MNFAHLAIGLSAVAALSGCNASGLASSTTNSGFGSVSGSRVNVSLSNELNDTVSNASVGTVAFVTGLDLTNGQAEGFAGIQSGANTGSAVTSGSANYNTTYAYQVIDDVNRTTTFLTGSRVTENGSMTLAADFNAGTLTGSNSELRVNGTISGTDVGGSVTVIYSGFVPGSGTVSGSATGNLDGNIGSTGVIGAFHGTDSDTVFAGGFVGTR
jgi:hypothetical protein